MNKYQGIIIIEDDKILLERLEKSFLARNFQVCALESAKDLKNSLKTFHPTHALVDLKIGSDSGLNCIKEIHDFDQKIKIVVLTGYASISTTIEAIKLGACYYLAKPANIDNIIAAFDCDNFSDKEIPLTSKKTSIKNLEWEYINRALIEANFNISLAAKNLGMHRRTLARKLEKRVL